jgi:hypothetical protein
MPFEPFKKVKKVNPLMGEPILVWLAGPADTGKSTLLLDFYLTFCPAGSLGILIPMDQRYKAFEDFADLEGIQIMPVSTDPTVWRDEDAILKSLRENMPGSGTTALAWDSVSPKFRELIGEAQTIADMTPDQRKAAIGNTNKVSAYQPKARFMEKVAVLATYGVNTVWVSHEYEGKDASAKDVLKTSITKIEVEKFRRNLNMHLRTGIERGNYFVQIVWARDRGSLSGKKLFDEPDNKFRGMWKRLSEAFNGAEVTTWDTIEFWAKPEDAITAAMEQFIEASDGSQIFPFDHIKHATNAYDKLKQEVVIPAMTKDWKAANASDKQAAPKLMAEKWKAEVARRLQERLEEYEKSLQPATEPEENPFDLPPEPEEENPEPQGEFAF